MYDSFASDIDLFSREFLGYIEQRNSCAILSRLKVKHLEELENEHTAVDKKNDLLMWNAHLAREAVKEGVFHGALHPLYNEFYEKIQKPLKIEQLQVLEYSLFETYLKSLISQVEVTEHYTINRILQYIHMHIENYISLNSIAEALGLSEAYIGVCFKKNMKTTVMAYVKHMKIDRSKHLMNQTNMSLTDIADKLGFYDLSHFSHVFKSQVGTTPSEYRANSLLSE